jgi:hypothetical protein
MKLASANLASANLASAYPDSNISAPMMLLVALVAAGSLAVWLIMVFRADRASARPGPAQRPAVPRWQRRRKGRKMRTLQSLTPRQAGQKQPPDPAFRLSTLSD